MFEYIYILHFTLVRIDVLRMCEEKVDFQVYALNTQNMDRLIWPGWHGQLIELRERSGFPGSRLL